MKIRLPIGIFALASGLLTGGGIARAQDANRDVVVTQSDMGSVVDRIQRGTGRFKDQFDHAVEHSMMGEKGLDKDAKHRADDLHRSANKLGDVFHDKRDKNNPAVRDQADRTLSAASEVNRVMMNHRFTDKLQSDWDNLRSDFKALAQVYGLSPLDAGAPAQ